MMRSLLALVAVLTLQVACQAGIVVKSVVVNDVFSGPGDIQQKITLAIRAGHDGVGANTDVGSFRFSLTPTVQPVSFSAVTPSTEPSVNSWPGSFDIDFVPTGLPQSGIEFVGNAKGLTPPPFGDPLSILVNWGVDSGPGLMGTVTLTYNRPLVGDVPVTFSLAATPDPLRGDTPGFISHDPYTTVSTAYQSGTGTIQGLSAVPEPSSFALVGLGILGLARRRRRS